MTNEEFICGLEDGSLDKNKIYQILQDGSIVCYKPENAVRRHVLSTFSWNGYVPVIDDNERIRSYSVVTDSGEVKMYSWVDNEGYAPNERMRLKGSPNVQIYPTAFIDRLNLRATALNPFEVHDYHGSGMRTNEGRVNVRDFKTVGAEPRVAGGDFCFYGLELEIGGEDYLDKIDSFFANPQNKDVFDMFDASNDSSLHDEGLELVSLPMSMEYIVSQKAVFEKLYAFVNDSRLTDQGSMHVHVDTKYLVSGDINFISLMLQTLWSGRISSATGSMLNFGNMHRIDVICGRTENGYCAMNNPLTRICRDHRNWLSGNDRTVEFRRFSANLNAEDMMNKLHFLTDTINAIHAAEKEYSRAKKQSTADGSAFNADGITKKLYITLAILQETAFLSKCKIIEKIKAAGDLHRFDGIYKLPTEANDSDIEQAERHLHHLMHAQAVCPVQVSPEEGSVMPLSPTPSTSEPMSEEVDDSMDFVHVTSDRILHTF